MGDSKTCVVIFNEGTACGRSRTGNFEWCHRCYMWSWTHQGANPQGRAKPRLPRVIGERRPSAIDGALELPLTQGYVAIVDAADYDDLVQFKWQIFKATKHYKLYAQRTSRAGNGRTQHEFMHRRLLPGAAIVDHINGYGLDNRRCNLRDAKRRNTQNRCGLDSHNTSGYRGVHWNKRCRKWDAYITCEGRHKFLGRFAAAEDAARRFDAAAVDLFGEFAGYLNFPDEQ